VPLVWLLAALAAGCGDDDAAEREAGREGDAGGEPERPHEQTGSSTVDAGPRDDSGALPPDPPGATRGIHCEGAQLHVLRVSGWPGGGVQWALQLRDAAGVPRSALEDTTLVLSTWSRCSKSPG
jgi:hypothetical protein